jgi:hypothetical protein
VCLDYGVLPHQEDDARKRTSYLAWRTVCLDYGLLPRQEDGVSGVWRVSPGEWCFWIIACWLAKTIVCPDYGVFFARGMVCQDI